jgi:hypothetical protein
MAHLDEIDVRLRAIRVVIDLLMWHGLDAFISDGDEINIDEFNTFSQESGSQVKHFITAIVSGYLMLPNTFSFATLHKLS